MRISIHSTEEVEKETSGELEQKKGRNPKIPLALPAFDEKSTGVPRPTLSCHRAVPKKNKCNGVQRGSLRPTWRVEGGGDRLTERGRSSEGGGYERSP